jgi:uncharacterized protein with GYD domain
MGYRATAMWFITLVKTKHTPDPAKAEQFTKAMMGAAEKMGIKVHMSFMTLGRYDQVWISEAPDISGPMRMSMMGMEEGSAETLVATSFEEGMKWAAQLPK